MSKSGKFWTSFQNLPAMISFRLAKYGNWTYLVCVERFMWPSMRCTMFWSVSGHLKCAKQSVVSFKVTLMYILFSSQTKDMLIYCKLFYFHIKMMTTKWFKSVSLKSFPKLCNVKNETNCSYISIFNMTRRYSKIGMFNIQVNSSLILVLF